MPRDHMSVAACYDASNDGLVDVAGDSLEDEGRDVSTQ